MSNTTTITGNLTREPEIRYTRDGQATTQLGVAVNRRWQDRPPQEWHEATSYFDVVCWRDLAENVALSLAKGMRVVVTGRLEQRGLGQRRGRAPDQGGDHRGRDRAEPALRHRRCAAGRTPTGGRINLLAGSGLPAHAESAAATAPAEPGLLHV